MYSVSTSPHPIPTQGPQYSIKLSCDRHLLAAAHKNISVEPILAVLKTILGRLICLLFLSNAVPNNIRDSY